MSFLCGTNCGTPADVNARYDDCTTDVFREYGFSHFILDKCSVQHTDLLDATEWGTRISAGNTKVGPNGTLVFGTPTEETFEKNGDGDLAVGKSRQTVDFYTPQTSDTLTDWVYWRDFFSEYNSWRVQFVDKNGIFYMEQDYATEVLAGAPASITGKTPGFKFSVTQRPRWEPGEVGYGRWFMQFTIEYFGIMGQALLPGVSAQLF